MPSKNAIQFDSAWVSNSSSVSPQAFYSDVTLSAEELVHKVRIDIEEAVEDKNIHFLFPNDTVCGESIFKTVEYYYNGDCLSLELPECLREAGVLEIVMEFKQKMDIFVHHPGQFLSPNSR